MNLSWKILESFSVVNGGIDGQTTLGHRKSFDTWFRFIPGLRPKYFLYYVGINDMYVPEGYGLENPKSERYDAFESFAIQGLKEEIRNRSALYNLFVVIRGAIWAHGAKVWHSAERPDDLKYVEIKNTASILDAAQSRKVQEYTARLRALFTRTRQFSPEAGLICVSQGGIGLWKSDADGKIWAGDPKRYFLLKAMNRALMSVCSEFNGIGVNLADKIRWEKADFYDSIHNTPRGAQKIADLLYSELKDKL